MADLGGIGGEFERGRFEVKLNNIGRLASKDGGDFNGLGKLVTVNIGLGGEFAGDDSLIIGVVALKKAGNDL